MVDVKIKNVKSAKMLKYSVKKLERKKDSLWGVANLSNLHWAQRDCHLPNCPYYTSINMNLIPIAFGGQQPHTANLKPEILL